MTLAGCATTFISYLWHYLVARLLYDDLIRPLLRGRLLALLPLAAIAVALFLVLRGLRRARSGRSR